MPDRPAYLLLVTGTAAVLDAAFASPETIAAEARDFDRHLLATMPAYGVRVQHVALPGAFPDASAATVAEAARRLGALPAGTPLLLDGVVLAALPVKHLRRLGAHLVALVHHPASLDPGLPRARQKEFRDQERAALGHATRVVVTSRSTRRALEKDFGLDAAKITVAEPGTDPAPRATGTGTPLQLFADGAAIKTAGYDLLVEALSSLADLDWRLTIAGATDRDAEAVESVETAIAIARMEERIKLAGQVVPATLERLYASADVFVAPARLEGYGIVLAQAMARGLPIVCASGGAAAEIVPAGAALMFTAGDRDALSATLASAIRDRKVRRRLADASWDAGRRLPTWNETARRVAAALMGLEA